jgi:3-keto-disaccharide hydrolase
MKKKALLAFLVLGLISTGITLLPGRRNAVSAEPSGWVDIMPTSTFAGWTRVTIPPDRPLPKQSQWSVAHGAIICAGDGGHEWLRYDRELGDFLFHVEWRLTKRAGAKNYNSGVLVRNDAKGLIWYQAQVGDSSGGYFFGDNPENGSLHRFNLHSALTKQVVKPAGIWNTYDLRCQGKKMILRVNGVATSEFNNCNNLRGYLGLEAEGSRIEFRHLRIKILD